MAGINYEGNKAAIADEWRKAGLSDTIINGWLARTTRESSFNPNALRKNDAGPGKHSYGIHQWNRSRLAALHRFAKAEGVPVDDVRMQARFALSEIGPGGTHAYIGEKFKNATNIVDVVNAAMMYENPKGASKRVNGKTVWTPQNGMHYKETLQAAEKFSGEKIDYSKATAATSGRPQTQTVWDVDAKHNNAINVGKQAEADATDSALSAAQSAIQNSIEPGNSNVIGNLANAFMPNANTTPNPAPKPMSIEEMASLFRPRLTWAGL